MKHDAFEAAAEKIRNWGRWGPQDARGTLNHVGPEALRRAAQEVTSGKTFSLGLPFDQNGPQHPGTGRINPMLYVTALDQVLNPHFPRSRYNDDVVHMSLQCATQWDALSHVHYDGQLYNGCNTCDALSTRGTTCNGIEHLANPGIVSRGVLVDIARLHKVDKLPADHSITPDQLNAACEGQGISVQPGDIVLVRTGHLRGMTVEGNPMSVMGQSAGLDASCAEWLHDKSVAAVAADNAAVEFLGPEAMACEVILPLHMLCLRDMGMPLGEMFDLEALSADCANDGRYAFLISAPPLGLTGAFGSPVNPMVLK